MPSTLVHVALGGLIGTALLGDAFDRRAIAVVMAVAAIPDLDTILGIWVPGAHRAVLHTMIWPVLFGVVLAWDTGLRPRSALRQRAGDRAVRVAWVMLCALLFAHVLYDGVANGVNLLWPVHDRFYDFSGELLVSTDRGIVQSFIEFGANGGCSVVDRPLVESTESVHWGQSCQLTKNTVLKVYLHRYTMQYHATIESVCSTGSRPPFQWNHQRVQS